MTTVAHSVETLPSLSFSRYVRLKRCMLSGAARGRASPLGALQPPRLRAQVLGDIFHAVMSGINSGPTVSMTGAEFRILFNRVVAEFYARIVSAPSSRHLGDPNQWPELATLYRRLVDVVELRRTGKRGHEEATYAEKTLRSKDGLLWGQIDAYFVSAEGIDLVDYKSGAILEEEEPKQDYVDQLYFYGYLLQENYGSYPKSLSLIGGDGVVVPVAPTPERSHALANDMRTILGKYNALVASTSALEDFANPASETCLFCDRKAICEKFWIALPSLETPAWNHVAMGVQVKPLVRTPRGGGWIDLAVERSSLPSEILKVTRVFEGRFPGVDLEHRTGQKLLVTALRQSNAANPAVVEATERTTILSMEAAS